MEFVKRSQLVQADIRQHTFEHSDLGLYTLHLNAVRAHKKMVFKKADLTDVRQRLQVMFPRGHDIPQEGRLEKLSPVALAFVDSVSGKGLWKVEWMYEGRYYSRVSPIYQLRFRPGMKGARDVYSKMTETLQFDKKEMGHKLWLESLHRPEQVVFYEGWAFQLDTECIVRQKASMMSFIYDFEHLVSITLIS